MRLIVAVGRKLKPRTLLSDTETKGLITERTVHYRKRLSLFDFREFDNFCNVLTTEKKHFGNDDKLLGSTGFMYLQKSFVNHSQCCDVRNLVASLFQ